jgi:hypothetical protein
LPYRFYNIFILLFIPAAILMRREFGPMLTAERRCRETGAVLRPGARPLQADEPAADDAGGGAWLMLVPLLVLVTAAFAGFWYDGHAKIMAGPDEKLRLALQQAGTFESLRLCFGKASAAVVLFQAALLAGLVSLGLWRWRQKQPLAAGITAWLSGARAMVLTAVVLVLPGRCRGAEGAGTARIWPADLRHPPPRAPSRPILPARRVEQLRHRHSYGTMGILMPLAVPHAHAAQRRPELVILASGGLSGRSSATLLPHLRPPHPLLDRDGLRPHGPLPHSAAKCAPRRWGRAPLRLPARRLALPCCSCPRG